MAHALQIDTLAFAKKLRAAGADEALADAIVEGITAADTSELATKSDLAELRTELKGDLAELRTELKEENSGLKVMIQSVLTEQRTMQVMQMRWMFGSVVVIVGMLIALK